MSADHFFQATKHEHASLSRQSLFRLLFAFMTIVLVLPVVGILVVLIVRGAPGMSLEFFLDDPRNGMREGGKIGRAHV